MRFPPLPRPAVIIVALALAIVWAGHLVATGLQPGPADLVQWLSAHGDEAWKFILANRVVRYSLLGLLVFGIFSTMIVGGIEYRYRKDPMPGWVAWLYGALDPIAFNVVRLLENIGWKKPGGPRVQG